jgi:REP element-mobilizing transposase RayT
VQTGVSHSFAMKFFDELAETRVTRNRLPHWQQDGATYFITYRLADSIPQELIVQWRRERDEWIVQNPQPWDVDTEKEYHRLFSAELDRMMDLGHGSCVLRKPEIHGLLADTFSIFEGKRYLLHSWVVMPNHVHLLLTMAEGHLLEKAVTSWKNFTARRINVLIESTGAVWQKDYFDTIIRDWDHFASVARYIRRNPAKAKLCEGDFRIFEDENVKRILG